MIIVERKAESSRSHKEDLRRLRAYESVIGHTDKEKLIRLKDQNEDVVFLQAEKKPERRRTKEDFPAVKLSLNLLNLQQKSLRASVSYSRNMVFPENVPVQAKRTMIVYNKYTGGNTMSETKSISNDAILNSFSGKVEFRLMNAYMFVAVLQKNRETLCHLVAALLHIPREEIASIQILNPIILGEDISKKDCVLDLLILLNDNTKINIEVQVENEGNWDDRGIYYLARNISDLETGEDYRNLKKVIQIGILDFTFPKGNTEFYQENMLINKRTHRIYSDKVAVNVLCLSQIENATRQDRESGLYQWAKVFKATTWEELKKMSEKNKTVRETVVTMAELTADEKIREQCRRREKYERDRISAIRYGVEQGIQQGIQQGIEQGIQQGIEQGIQQGIQQSIPALVRLCTEFHMDREDIIERVMRDFSVSKEEAEKNVDLYLTGEDESIKDAKSSPDDI